MARGFPFTTAGLMALIALVLFHESCSSEDNQHCPPSSCGNIHNISYPFRLRTDPITCGDLRYNLSCENNHTVLYLFEGKYDVQAINYNNYTIRIVDSAEENSCVSENPGSVVFMSCENPVNSPFYLDTSTCIDNGEDSSNTSISHSKRYNRYVIDGTTKAKDVEDSCKVDQTTFLTNWPGYDPIISCNKLVYGFELSWLQGYCDNYCRKKSDGCYLDDANQVHCFSQGLLRYILNYILSYVRNLFDVEGLLLGTKIVLGPCVIAFLIYKWRRRHLSMYDAVEEFLQSQNNLMPIRYSYSEIKKSTKGFKDKLGEGGYGTVYKGKLQSGSLVGIKMLGKSKANGQEFISEVATIGRIHHTNVVQLLGFCAEGPKRALIYEFMPNGSLEKYIFSRDGSIPLSIEKIYKISLGVARGIEYLHQGSDDSIVSLTAARGTLGYIAPELFYKNIGGASYKADVYSFGMLLMEMASRRKNFIELGDHSSQFYFPTWIYDQFREGNDIEMEDATEEEKKIVKKMILVALWCIQMKPVGRPSMNRVVEMLEGEVECLQMPSKPFLSSSPERPVGGVGENSNSTCSSIQSGESSQSTQL
uniref:Protein kinase domain-containing protein n=1 Tax=Fagus sylvatica TaxID=28930 RepID=A0A2N9EPP2_FAGSY